MTLNQTPPREIAEIRYQFDDPFVVDSTTAQTTFGLAVTPMHDALAETISWYRNRTTTKDAAGVHHDLQSD